jgi:hypothetical protein
MAAKYMRAPDWFRKGDGLFAVEGGITIAIAEPTRIAVANATSFTVLVTAATGILSANFGQITILFHRTPDRARLKLSF